MTAATVSHSLLASTQPTAAPKFLVGLRRSGFDTPLFMVHSLAGELTWLTTLAGQLDARWPVFGFAAPGLNSPEPFFASLQEMAANYLAAIRLHQPFGPYILGGYSFGGVLAYEMVRQLQAKEQEVRALILIDSYAPNDGMTRKFDGWSTSGLLVQVVANLFGTQWNARQMIQAGELPVGDNPAQIRAATQHLLRQCNVPYGFEAIHSHLSNCHQVMLHHAQLLAKYRPPPLVNPVLSVLFHNTLGFIGESNPLCLEPMTYEERFREHGWNDLIFPPPRRLGIGTEHFMIALPPASNDLAILLGQYLKSLP